MSVQLQLAHTSQRDSCALQLESPDVIHGHALFNDDRTLRYRLERYWGDTPTRWVVWLMLNPSVANEKRNDPTASRITQFTKRWGYNGWIAVNLYPFISADPKAMWAWADWENNGPDWYTRDSLMCNEGHIEEMARLASLRIVAFGAQPMQRDSAWLEHCLEAFGQPSSLGADENLYCLGTNSNDQPLHPMARGKMRVPDATQPQLWRAA